jgi:uncharacterized protein YukE
MSDLVADFEAMAKAARIFKQASDAFEETANECKQMGAALSDGALLGIAGQKATQALEGTLAQGFTKMAAKLEEISTDINRAIADLRAGASESAGRFSSR